MKEKFLPIGTVVLLKTGTKKIMITGFLPVAKDKTVYDYSACLFPEGIISNKQTAVFNHDQIAEVIQEGYSNEETAQFVGALNELIAQQNIVTSDGPAGTEPETLEDGGPEKAPMPDIDIPIVAAAKEEEKVMDVLSPSAPEPTEMPKEATVEQPAEEPKVEETPAVEETPKIDETPAVAEEPVKEVQPAPAPAELAPAAPAAPASAPAPEPTPTITETPVDPSAISSSSESSPVGVESIKPFSE